jgi:predicted glycosyltransferase
VAERLVEPGQLTVWIDIDSPPQVQYMLPFKPAFEHLGARVIVTARDVGITYDLLERSQASFHAVGAEFGGSTPRKVVGNIDRAVRLIRVLRREGKPDLALGNARAAVLAAAALRAPSFVILDYEYAHVATYALARSYVLHPEVIDSATLQARRLSSARLIAFSGLKEDISLHVADFEGVTPASFGPTAPNVVKVLVRPPAEESHYYREESRTLTLELLNYLSQRRDVLVILSPRHDWQVADLDQFEWANEPVALIRPLPSLSLLKGVDVVISAGGTMLREAAYLGIPAYSLFQSATGKVDLYLETLGRITMITKPSDFGRLEIAHAPRARPLNLNPNLREDLVAKILEHARSPRAAATVQTP